MIKADAISLAKGIFTDVDPLKQPKDTYRVAYNAVLESRDGNYTDLMTELGNKICVQIPKEYTNIVGSHLLDNNDLVLFLKGINHDAIVIQTSDCKLQYLVKSTCLNFSSKYLLDIEYRLYNGCERVIYFTDGINPIRYINLDSLNDHLTEDIKNDDTLSTTFLKTIYANNNDGWDCESFKLFPNVVVPYLTYSTVNNFGGRLKVGSYSFAIRYLDFDLNPTAWLYITKPISIYNTSSGEEYNKIIGGINGSAQNASATGDNNLPPTNKSIVLDLANLDTRFAYYQIAAVEYTDNKGVPIDVYTLYQVPITSSITQYTYTGVNASIDQATTINELLAQFPDIQTAKHILQENNRLYYAKTTGKKINWERFQQEASKVYSKYIIEAAKKQDNDEYLAKNPYTYFYKSSYMRDEVYAFAIVWIFKDGSSSPAFHIPGRPANINPSTCLPFSNVGGTITKKCLKIVIEVEQSVPCNNNAVGYTLEYTVDGVLYTKVGGFTTNESKTIYVYCNNNTATNISVQNFEYDVFNANCNFQATPFVEIETEVIQYGGNPLIDNIIAYDGANPNDSGIDKSIILNWSADISHIYPDEATYNALDTDDKLRVWQVYNTAYKEGENTGYMAYYECTSNTYPDVRNCNNESIWGTDICGNPLVGTPIRHHKFPDALLEPIQSQQDVYNMGIEFNNIIPPAEYADQVSHFIIVRDVREEINKTVVDKGLADRFLYAQFDEDDEEERNAWLYFRSKTAVDNDVDSYLVNMRMLSIFTPKSVLQRSYLGADYVKFERKYFDSFIADGGVRYENLHCDNISDDGEGGNDDSVDLLIFNKEGSTDLRALNRGISSAKYIDHLNSGLPSEGAASSVGVTIDNELVSNYLGSIHLYANKITQDVVDFPTDWANPDFDEYLRYAGPIYYVALKRYKNVYCNLEALKYTTITDHPIPASVSSIQTFGGDIFISRLEWSLQDWDASRTFVTGWFESEINSELRHSDGTVCGTRFLGSHAGPSDVCAWMTRFTNDPDWRQYVEDEVIGFNKYVCADPLYYNIDFNYINPAKTYFPLPLTFDYCNKCINDHPYRIWASKQSFQEERIDSYRSVLANSYIDLVGDHGEITNIFTDKKRFFIHTEKDIWQLQTRPYEVRTTENNLYVGTGDIFSIPPERLVITPQGYGGSKDKWATITTEHGTIFIDRNNNVIFLLTDGLTEISQNGNRNWFENNLDLFFHKDFRATTGVDYQFDSSTSDSYNVGYSAVYDPRYRRYIVHKRDFKFTAKLKADYRGTYAPTNNPSGYQVGFIVYDTVNQILGRLQQDGSVTPLNRLDKTLFQNKSWTYSYSLVHKQWVSFHGYMPNYMYSNHSNFFTFNNLYSEPLRPGSSVNVNNIWEHNIGPVTTYYNTKHSFFVDFIANEYPLNNKRLESLQYISRVDEFVPQLDSYIERTDSPLSKFYAYNTDQITSTNDIKPYDNAYESIEFNRTVSLATRWLNQFLISKNLRDIAINRNTQPLFTSEWLDTNYNGNYDIDGYGNGWVDRVPNELARDVNKDIYQRAKMRDRWFGIRVYYHPDEDLRLVLQSVITNKDIISQATNDQ